MRIDVFYDTLYAGVRYKAESGSIISWEDSIITDLGNDETRLNGHPVSWRPDTGGNDGDTVTVTILHDVRDPGSMLAKTVLPILADGEGWVTS